MPQLIYLIEYLIELDKGELYVTTPRRKGDPATKFQDLLPACGEGGAVHGVTTDKA
jgi:hypothetical protein